MSTIALSKMVKARSFFSSFVNCICCTPFQEDEKLVGKGRSLQLRVSFGNMDILVS
jgi:hypothetical protein